MKRPAAWLSAGLAGLAGGSVLLLAGVAGGAAGWATRSDAAAPASLQPALGTPAACARYGGEPTAPASGRQPSGMVKIAGGDYTPGSDSGYPDERPAGAVHVAPFWMDRTEVSNAQFQRFVEATGHVTEAERDGAAAVFQAPASANRIERDGSWWRYVKGADWRHPEGPQSSLTGRAHEPVVHVTLADALAYARWLGRDLPTEAEWEYAARGRGQGETLERAPRDAAGKPLANFWQGVFPELNSREDGYAGRSPVGCFAANGWGLHDMIGNVWEWTRDPYTGPRQAHGNGDPYASVTAAGGPPSRGAAMVIKGGSFLCAANYCARYRASARHPQEADLAAAHVGFRTVWRGS